MSHCAALIGVPAAGTGSLHFTSRSTRACRNFHRTVTWKFVDDPRAVCGRGHFAQRQPRLFNSTFPPRGLGRLPGLLHVCSRFASCRGERRRYSLGALAFLFGLVLNADFAHAAVAVGVWTNVTPAGWIPASTTAPRPYRSTRVDRRTCMRTSAVRVSTSQLTTGLRGPRRAPARTAAP